MNDIDKALNDEEGWAIVVTAGGKYVGKLDETDVVSRGLPLLRYPQEFHASLIPRQGPQGVVFERMIQAYSVSRCLDVENTVMHVTPIDILYFKDMSPHDRAWHKELVRSGITASTEARAHAIGLLTPPRKGMNSGNA